MQTIKLEPSKHPLAEYIHRLESGEALLKDSPQNLIEVVGILKSYGIVLDAYSRNLIYNADHQFLVLFPFFKYFNGSVSPANLLRHWWHDRINFEYAEYCMKAMLWHGGGGLDTYVDSPEFCQAVEAVIQAKIKGNPVMLALHRLFPEFLPEQMRQMAYYSGLGQFWRVMSDIFIDLSDRYDAHEIKSIPQVVEHILNGLVAAANKPITYQVTVRDRQNRHSREGGNPLSIDRQNRHSREGGNPLSIDRQNRHSREGGNPLNIDRQNRHSREGGNPLNIDRQNRHSREGGNPLSIDRQNRHSREGGNPLSIDRQNRHSREGGNPLSIDRVYEIIPESAGLTFLMDTAVPYVEAIFFRGAPFLGTVSFNAQAYQIPYDQSKFTYGALYADPLPIGGAGIPPTLLMQDMRHFLPDYLHDLYQKSTRGEDDLRVQICQTFQKSMFCVTTAAIRGLAPYPLDTSDPEQQKANRAYLENWMNRFMTSRIVDANR